MRTASQNSRYSHERGNGSYKPNDGAISFKIQQQTKWEVKAVSMLSHARTSKRKRAGKFVVQQLKFFPRHFLSVPSGCEVEQASGAVWKPRQREKVLLFPKIETPTPFPQSSSPWQINIQITLLV
jgi:hypothetical protein